MNLVAITCLWQRHELAAEVLQHTRHVLDLPVVAVGSEGRLSRKIAEDTGAVYIEHENRPLGRKWNAALAGARELEADAVMVLGSDDLVPLQTLKWLMRQAEHHPFVGLLDFILEERAEHQRTYQVSLSESDGGPYSDTAITRHYWPGYEGRRSGEPVGSGRIISAALLERVDWKLWADDTEKSLDGDCTTWLAAHGVRPFGIWAGDDTVVAVRVQGEPTVSDTAALVEQTR